MSVLKNGYDINVEQNHKDKKDYTLTEVTNKEGGTELVEKVIDYKKIQETNGTVEMWDTQKLKEAGIRLESMTPKNSNGTRIEGEEKAVEAAQNAVNRIKEEIKK